MAAREENVSVPEKNRRTVIKKSMQLAAAAYVAPITMQLLTATRATAQSVAPAACTCATFQITNPYGAVDINYTDCSGVARTITMGVDTQVGISALVGSSVFFDYGNPFEWFTVVCNQLGVEIPG